ncbi:hypothetical protein ABZ769_08090 [Streptomyces olivoreticuli]
MSKYEDAALHARLVQDITDYMATPDEDDEFAHVVTEALASECYGRRTGQYPPAGHDYSTDRW